MIEIVGAEGKIDDVDNFLKIINDFSENNGLIIQVFNSDLIKLSGLELVPGSDNRL